MGWIVFGIIAFVVTLWVWRHTYTDREKVYDRAKRDYFDHPPYHWWYKPEDRLPLPRWAMLLLVVLLIIPIVNIVCIGIEAYYYTSALLDRELFFHLEGNRFTRAISAFFTKDVFEKNKSE